MPATYPDAIKSFTTKTDGVDDILASHINDPQLEITAIETDLLGERAAGWVPANETWTYVSTTTFTIVGNKTGKYQIGDKIRLVQTTTKYFYITAISYGPPNTTVTITGGSDYSLTNAAITLPFYSKVEAPQSFPQYFNYTPTWASVGNPQPAIGNGTLTGIFSIRARVVLARLYMTAGTTTTFGTGNWSFLMPITGKNNGFSYLGLMRVRDAGTNNYHRQAQFSPGIDANNISIFDQLDSATNVGVLNATTPFTWGSGDNFGIQIEYDMA